MVGWKYQGPFDDLEAQNLPGGHPFVKDDLIQDDLTLFEFNEKTWDNIQVDAGLYLAEIKSNGGQSELVRVGVIR